MAESHTNTQDVGVSGAVATVAQRTLLPARRHHEAFEFVFSRGPHDNGTSYTIGLGRYPDGRLAEVFVDCHKLASSLTDDARDVGIALSIQLQHGVPLAALAGAVARRPDGAPCGLTGGLVEAIMQYEAGAAEGSR
ncbi:hypothetical protein ACQVP2_22445 [Methylobacterium aquaticum]|uniref:hypothetical protein n=1 Tax=Methylobacterium aquaticum TaxID=270351 RepID=UPI003D185D09